MRRTLAALAVLAVAGCSASSSTASNATPKAPAAPVTVQPWNPVTILKLAGAIPDPGETVGSAGGFGINGNQVADGQFRPGHASTDVMGSAEYVTVITSLTEADHAATLAQASPQDAQAVISGPHLSVIVVNGVIGVAWGSPAEHGPSPQVIAARVGGTVVSQH